MLQKILKEQIKNTKKKINHKEIDQLLEVTYSAKELLTSDLKPQNKLNKLGGLLSEGWELKQKFSNNVSNTKIKKIYDKGMKAGAYGGKLCGAGGGGFILF